MPNTQNPLHQMQEIVTLYFYYLDYLNAHDALEVSSINNSKEEASVYVAKVFRSFITLNDEDKEILNKEYFARVRSGWWMSKYQKTNFDLLLVNAVNKFLRRFYSL